MILIFGHLQSASQIMNQKSEPNRPANTKNQIFKIIVCHHQREQKTITAIIFTIPIMILIQLNPKNKYDQETLQLFQKTQNLIFLIWKSNPTKHLPI